MNPAWISILVTVGGIVATLGMVWGSTRSQTAYLEEKISGLREALRHHTQTDHPRIEADLREAMKDLAVLRDRDKRRPSYVDQDERKR